MGLLNVGTQALQANLIALQTIGNNIANVNTVGYSRQRVTMETVPGQYTGVGYIGKGVGVQDITRNYDEYLTRQSALANSQQSADITRSDYLKQLTDIFQGGTSGMGAAINDMLNSFSDVANTPTDLTARTVALTRVDEATRRMRTAAQSLDDLQVGLTSSLKEKVNSVNTLAQQIAGVNNQIANALGSGKTPNDLLDKRDQLIKDLSGYIQTSSIKAADGTVSVFIGGSQPLVMGDQASTISLGTNDFGDSTQNKLMVHRGAISITLDENTLGGGEISGMLRFQNNDLAEGRNLLGRLTTGITTSMNNQHKLGLDLDGQPGGNLFTPANVNNVLSAINNSSTSSAAAFQMDVADPSKLAASDYLITITTDAVSGSPAINITRTSDGQSVPVTDANGAQISPFLASSNQVVYFDGLKMDYSAASAPAAGDRFLIKPYSSSASNVAREFSTPRALAVASPVVGQMGTSNSGSLQLASLVANANPQTNVPVTITFDTTGPTPTYSFSGPGPFPGGTGPFTYTSGQDITSTDTPNSWTLKLQGVPNNGDTFKVSSISDPSLKIDPSLNGGNAIAMMNLRDAAMFDGASMGDGYAGLISQIGVRSQSAIYSAQVSTNIATNATKDVAGISGVNLDEEAAKLLQYQQAYQASAKMIQMAQTIMDTLFQTIAR